MKLMKPPLKGRIRSKKELYTFAKKAFGLRFARHAVCSGHQAPLDAVWDIYSGNVRNAVIVGSRMSGKTSIIAFLHSAFALTYEGCESVSVAARKDQAKYCYDYVRRMLYYHPLFQKYTPPPQTPNHSSERLILHTGSIIRILPATEKGLNAPHPHKVFFDEVDLIDWYIIQQGLSMAKSDEAKGIVGQQVFASSWKRSFGPLARIVKAFTGGVDWNGNAVDFVGGKVYRWCVFDVMKRCESPSWCEECKRITKKLSSGEEISFYDICQGRGLHADGFLPRHEAIMRFIQMDEAIFRSEWLSDEPAPAYAVFNIPPTSYLTDWDIDNFPDAGIVVGVDVGTSSPTVFLLIQVLPSGIAIVFDEIRRYGLSISGIVEEARRILEKYGSRIIAFVLDPRATLVLKEMQSLRIKVVPAPFLYSNTAARQQEKINRIRLIQAALDVSVLGIPRLYFVSHKCELLLREMKEYAFETDPEGNPTDKLPDGYDDGIDALAYAFSFMEVSGLIRRDVPLEFIKKDFEVVKRYISQQGDGVKLDEQPRDVTSDQDPLYRRLRQIIDEQMRRYPSTFSNELSPVMPSPEVLDERMLQLMRQMTEIFKVANNPEIPEEEREKLQKVAQEIKKDLERAWTAAEIKAILSGQVINPNESIPFFFTDALFRL